MDTLSRLSSLTPPQRYGLLIGLILLLLCLVMVIIDQIKKQMVRRRIRKIRMRKTVHHKQGTKR